MRAPAFLFSVAFSLVFLALGLVVPAAAEDYKLGSLEIAHVWARPSTGKTGAAYFDIANAGKADDALIGVETDAAAKVQIHDMTMDGNVMRMRKIDRVPVAAGQTVKIAPGGLHIMLIGLKAPLTEGGSFPMRVSFEKAGSLDVKVHVETPGKADDGMTGMGKMK